MAPPAARMDPRTPVARPMSCGSMTSVTPGKVMLSTKPILTQERTPRVMNAVWPAVPCEIEDREVTKANDRHAAVTVWYLTLGTKEIARPPRVWPSKIPPPTTDDCQPIARTLVVYTVPIIVGQRIVIE